MGLLPLVVGSVLVYRGLWSHRAILTRVVSGHSGFGFVGVFGSGLGLGLLVASAFSGFFWWWAIGAVVFMSTVVAAAVAVTRVSTGSRS